MIYALAVVVSGLFSTHNQTRGSCFNAHRLFSMDPQCTPNIAHATENQKGMWILLRNTWRNLILNPVHLQQGGIFYWYRITHIDQVLFETQSDTPAA